MQAPEPRAGLPFTGSSICCGEQRGVWKEQGGQHEQKGGTGCLRCPQCAGDGRPMEEAGLCLRAVRRLKTI